MIYFRTINAWSGTDHSANLLLYTTAAAATAAALRATFDVNFTITGAGYQPGGGSWTATSDARFKRDVGPYGRGLDAVRRLRPINFRYHGLAGHDPDRVHCGLAAEEVAEIMPEMVHTLPIRVREDDPEMTAVLCLNATPLAFALVNAVSELARRLEVLEGRA